MQKKFRGYIFSRSFYGERVPQYVQNLVIRDFCNKNNFAFLLSKAEYSMENSYSILKYSLNELKKIDGMVFYSVFMLPENYNLRKFIYQAFMTKKKELYFALENKKIKNFSDIQTVEEIFLIKKCLNFCLKDF
jgi:sporadic carbohydrate cluster protein (TIGR04323 family)